MTSAKQINFPLLLQHKQLSSILGNRHQRLGSLLVLFSLLETACIPIGGSAPEWKPESSSTSETTEVSTDDTSTSVGGTESATNGSGSASESNGETTTEPTTTTSDSDTGSLCGNTILDDGEECDDGNQSNEDACLVGCNAASCGDGYVHAGLEECDDGNQAVTDGCRPDCTASHPMMVSAGSFHTCVVMDTGNVRCWGSGGTGQLGYMSIENIGDNEKPVSKGNVKIGELVTQMSCAQRLPLNDDEFTVGHHTCGLLVSGEVRCWGAGEFGALGQANTNNIGDDEFPSSIVPIPIQPNTKIKQIAAGAIHTCALLETGFIKCWGSGWVGQLGYGNTLAIGDDETPAEVGYVSVGGTVTQMATGGEHTCALSDGGKVRCWGNGEHGQLGYANTSGIKCLDINDFFSCKKNDKDGIQNSECCIGDNEAPSTAGDVDVGSDVIQISAGTYHTCALLDTGKVHCWGHNFYGQLGYGNTNDIGDDETPSTAGDVNIGNTAVQISAGGYHTCALLDTGKVRCWGHNAYGQLGYKHTNNIGDGETPSSAGDVNVGGTVVQISAGGNHTCALLETGDVRCWGDGSAGQLGYGNTNDIGDNETPASAGNVPYR